MYTYLTPKPVTLEIRNAAGEVWVDLSETTTTTVSIETSSAHPLGFLDDIVRSFRSRGRGAWGGEWGAPSAAEDAGPSPVPTADFDPTELVRVEHAAPEPTDDEPTSGGTVMIDADPARGPWRPAFVIRVTAPLGSSLRVQGHSADLQVHGAADRVDVRTASGDVRMTEVRGNALVHTASGDIVVDRAGADVDLRTASGDVRVGPIAANALVQTTSGNITLAASGGSVTARSVSGDVRLADAMSGAAEVNAVTGDVEIGVHAGTRASVELTTLTGSTNTDFAISETVSDADAPTLEIKVKTTSGDIRLCRAA